MTVGILAEKPDAARKFATALGGMSGTYAGEQYVIANARGHLYEFKDPAAMVAPDLRDKYKNWNLENLPWNLDDLSWELDPIPDTGKIRNDIAKTLASCDELVVACDVDPTGEGGMIAVNAFKELGLHPKTWSRMYFVDDTAPSLQKSFKERKPISSLDDFDEYREARYRSMFDLSSMQFTRIATAMARASGKNLVLRQGRLKSAMVSLVGDQLKAYNDYVKKSFFQNRFRDENNVVYTNPEEQKYDKAEQVPQEYSSSSVVTDSTTMKSTAPPKLLDLAGLSSKLVGKGIKTKQVLSTYQKMYEAQIVSYPRTEDKTITPEQFNELLPLVDEIAGVVGVDTSDLTHRTPRKTHVKPQGAHGANRPGPNVPSSLSALSSYGPGAAEIYEMLAKNYLATIAEDYEYEQQKGHVEKYPDFKGTANVPKVAGWKAVFDPDADRDDADDEDENGKGLGTNADPFIFEGANKRPPHPTMEWLMAQLGKRDVGTGATRANTYAEVTNEKSKYPLMVEKGKKVTLAEAGEMSWRLLPDTHIGDLAVTEKVYANMRAIAKGEAEADECLKVVADWVREDIETMQRNAATMREQLGLKEEQAGVKPKAEGVWQASPNGPQKVKFSKIWAGHEFTDDEIEKLLAGEKVSFEANKKAGGTFTATGQLGLGEFKGRKFVGFQLEQRPKADKPTTWSGYTFSDQEVEDLLAGKTLGIFGFVSKKNTKYGCEVSWNKAEKKIEPNFDCVPFSMAQRKFTEDERKKLADGETLTLDGFVSKKGSTFSAPVEWNAKTKKASFRFDKKKK